MVKGWFGSPCSSVGGVGILGEGEIMNGKTTTFLMTLIDNRNSWVSTGLYLPEGQVAQITLPSDATNAKLKVKHLAP